ncbi:MAG: hypothetical protein QMC98_02995 [Candidatus Thermoplasmatota archaeon]|nr:hypothetical protein [Candidatus Thermoplasmatota archaeon]
MKKALLCFIATLILMVTQLATSVNAPVPAHYESKISTVFLRADNYYSTTGSSGIATLYQRDAVVAYADKYWDVYNPAYDDYSGSG